MNIRTMMRIARNTLLIVVAMASTVAMAAGTPADELLRDSDAVLQQIDAAQDGALWDNAAPFIKTKIGKPQFVAQTQRERQSFGSVATRGWASVTRVQYTNDRDVPDGLYANVDYTTRTTDGQTVFELVSFQLAPNGDRHLAGYSVRRTQQVNPTIQQNTPKP